MDVMLILQIPILIQISLNEKKKSDFHSIKSYENSLINFLHNICVK